MGFVGGWEIVSRPSPLGLPTELKWLKFCFRLETQLESYQRRLTGHISLQLIIRTPGVYWLSSAPTHETLTELMYFVQCFAKVQQFFQAANLKAAKKYNL